MPDNPNTPVGTRWRPGSVLTVVALLALAGLALWTVWRGAEHRARSTEGERDFDVTLICSQCGHMLETTFARMHELPPPTSAPSEQDAASGPITVCPRCQVGGVFRAAPCPQCGKPALVNPAEVDGKQIGPRCFSCDWRGDRSGSVHE